MITPMMQHYLFDHVLMNRVHVIDAMELCALLPDESVDAVLFDPPYGQTSLEWDKRVDFFDEILRVIKPKCPIVITAIMPYAAQLIVTYQQYYRYEWIWQKSLATGFLDCSWKPMREHEYILVFSKGGKPAYYPQMTEGEPYIKKGGQPAIYHSFSRTTNSDGLRYPRSVQSFQSANTGSNINSTVHPTQKPIALFEYLVKTYTQEGDVVFDPFVGSGTTALAARNCKRRYICGDQSPEYVAIARDRVRLPFEARHMPVNDDVSHLPMFAK